MAHLFLHTPNEQLHVWGAVSQARILPGSPRTTCFSPLHCLAASPSSAHPAALPFCLRSFPPSPWFLLLPVPLSLITLLLSSLSLYAILYFLTSGLWFYVPCVFSIKAGKKKTRQCFCFCFYYPVVLCGSPSHHHGSVVLGILRT